MARWLGAVKAQAVAIGEADAVDTGGCHTSYLQGFITMGNIGGWLEDAPKAFAALEWQGMSTVDADGRGRERRSSPYPLVGVISPWNAPLMLALLDAVPGAVRGHRRCCSSRAKSPRG